MLRTYLYYVFNYLSWTLKLPSVMPSDYTTTDRLKNNEKRNPKPHGKTSDKREEVHIFTHIMRQHM